jgi:glycosyltransferase involved in cell wall biosynthesis
VTRVLFVVTADLPHGVPAVDDSGATAPRKDYAAIAAALGADVLDRTAVLNTAWGRLVARLGGVALAQACAAFLRRAQYDAVLTDGEHIGLPLALLLKLSRACTAHVTIGHRISAPKKRPLWRWARAWTHVDRILLHATLQRRIALEALGIPAERLVLVPYQVDTSFWDPAKVGADGVAEERLIVSAGLELRDYPALFRAVDGLDARVSVAAASHWSKRRNSALDAPRPANVTVTSLDYARLRDLYARAAIVVVPVVETDFQAGVTTILEAMAMGKPVVVTRTSGQTDVIVDGANGVYVPVADPAALRSVLVRLLDDPTERARLGAAARETVTRFMRVDQFAERVATQVHSSLAARQTPGMSAELKKTAAA